MSEAKSEDEEMKEEIDTVKNLLGRLQNERKNECAVDEQHKGTQAEVISEINQKAVSLLINLKSAEERENEQKGNTTEKMDDDCNHTDDSTDGTAQQKHAPHKRKQDRFLAELHEKAEVISKSARTSAEGVIVKIDLAPNLEEDPEASEFLKKIRSSETGQTSPTEMDVENKQDDASSLVGEGSETMEGKVKLRHPRLLRHKNDEDFQKRRHTTTAVVDFSNIPSDFTIDLNLDPQKSRISLVKQGGLKDRRKPTVEHRRSRPTSLLFLDEMNIDEALKEEEDKKMKTSPSALIPSPSIGDGEGLKPRVSPKTKFKSKTVAGIVIPGLSEAIQARQQKKTEVPRKVSTAELVKGAKIEKENRAIKEERVEKTPQKPAWLLEAEARRKHHDRRRSQKTKAEETVATSSVTTSAVSVSLSGSLGNTVVSGRTRDEPVERVKTTFSVPFFGKENHPLKHGTSELSSKADKKDISSVSLVNTEERLRKAHSFKFASDKNTESKPMEIAALSDIKTNKLKPIPRKNSDLEVVLKSTPEKKGENAGYLSPTLVSPNKLIDSGAEESGSASPLSIASPPFSPSASSIGSPTRLPSSPTRVTVNGSTIQQAKTPAKVGTVKLKPTPKPKPKPIVASKTDNLKASKSDVQTQRRRVESTSTDNIQTGSSRVAPSNNSAGPKKEYGHTRGYGEYKPVFTGEIVPQWKKDLLQKKKNVKDVSHENHAVEPEPHVAELKVVPKWKKELMERKKGGQRDRPTQPKEPKPAPASKVEANGEPPWMRELHERKKKGGSAPVKVATDGENVSEIRRRMSDLRHRPMVIIPQKTEVDAKPSFMREFEEKKRGQSRTINPMRQSPGIVGTPPVPRPSAKSYV